jgi:transposase
MLLAITPEDLVPVDHPIRRIRVIADAALAELSATFTAMYALNGRRSVPPEHLLKSTLLMALYSIRSERQFCERLQYDLLFKWFLGLNISDRAFDHATFSKNRERLLKHAVAEQFLAAVTEEAQRRQLISDDHFTVDGTLLQAVVATPRWISAGSGAGTTRTSHRPTPKPGWRAKGGVRRRTCATRGTCSWRTGMGSSSMSTSARRRGPRSGMPRS